MKIVIRNIRGTFARGVLCFIFLGAVNAAAQSPVALTVDTLHHLAVIPPDFSGLSIEIGSLRSGNGGVTGNWFDDSTHSPQVLHAQMINLFANLGIRNVRVGGGSVDQNNIIPTNADIDAFFRFAEAAHLSVIYSLRLLYGNITQDTTIAKYVWDNYHQYLQTLAIGNEPDWPSYRDSTGLITGYPSYLSQWKLFASAVATAVPDVKFGGPDTGSNYPIPGARDTYYNGSPWTVDFMNDTKSLGNVTGIYLHNYVGQGASGTPQGMADAMLSSGWDTSYYPALYGTSCVPVLNAGLPYRLTESNSFSGGIAGGSTSFATALFALDYMHWWAAHGAAGVNFHNKQWVLNDAIYMDAYGNYLINPMGYGIAAFRIGGHGIADSVAITNPDKLNITAYAVSDSTGGLFVTIVNKEHITSVPFTPAPRDAKVSISANGFPDTASVMYMAAPGKNVLATGGMTLGEETISNSAPFRGKWSPVDTVRSGYYVVRVPYATAAIVRIGGPFVSIATPTALRPVGEVSVPRRASLEWGTSSLATGYDLQIASDSAFTSVVFDTTMSAGDTTIQLSTPLNASTKYYWHVQAFDGLYTSAYSPVDSFITGTGILSVGAPSTIPNKFALSQNYPNPFNPSTAISYELSAKSYVTLRVYNVLGQEVASLVNETKMPGTYRVEFDGSRLASGVYIYRLSAGTHTAVKKMVLVK